jgi:glycosyltransferase involved in cell wall biosynthesis
MKVAALTSGKTIPSARFRVRQYLPALLAEGIDVTDYCPGVSQGARLPGRMGQIRARYLPPLIVAQTALNLMMRVPGITGSHRADLTWLERNFIPGLDDFSGLLKRPIVLDIDDAIWLYNPFGQDMIKRLVRRVDMVLAGNQFIADWCGNYCKSVQIVPTAINCDQFQPRAAKKTAAPRFVIGWTGTSGNFKFLKMVEPALAHFLQKNPDAEFLVVADRAPHMPSLPAAQVSFRNWSPDTEHEILHEMDVGIMPIDDSDISRGKCSFKMLQYMATGLPVVVSPYGMNGLILQQGQVGLGAVTHDDWVNAFEFFHSSRKEGSSMGVAGRALAMSHYSTRVVTQSIARNFRTLG